MVNIKIRNIFLFQKHFVQKLNLDMLFKKYEVSLIQFTFLIKNLFITF